jgi:putative transposase
VSDEGEHHEEEPIQRSADHRNPERVRCREEGCRPCSRHGISEATFYTWKSKYGGMDVSEAQRLKALDDENRRLKHMVADLSLDKEMLKAVIRKNVWSAAGLQPKTDNRWSAQMYSASEWAKPGPQ